MSHTWSGLPPLAYKAALCRCQEEAECEWFVLDMLGTCVRLISIDGRLIGHT